ncbi:hypothetical protein FRB97_008862 [Tulasnella sp. 331]|nr:hypothetical protein FRB97_008862 [Tulasnella sp. 331]
MVLVQPETLAVSSSTALSDKIIYFPLGFPGPNNAGVVHSTSTSSGRTFLTLSIWNGGRLFPLQAKDSFSSVSRFKTVVLVASEPSGGYGDKDVTGSGDIWIQLQALGDVLQDPNAIIYILTERLVVGWLGEFQATVVVDAPTKANIKFATETAASQCAPEGTYLLWLCCDGRVEASPNGPAISVLKPMDGWGKAISGEELKHWTSAMDPSGVLTVMLEVCNAGNFMDLPHEFAPDGTLVTLRDVNAGITRGPYTVCISACRQDELAWLGWWRDKKCGAFTSVLKSESLRLGQPNIYLQDVNHIVAEELKRWPNGGQHPLIAMSHAEQTALLTLPGFQRPSQKE